MNASSRSRAWAVVVESTIAFALTLVLALHTGDTRAASVAMATDVQGKVSTSAGGAKRDVEILSEIADGAQVELAPSAQLVAVYLKSGEEFTLSGPAVARFTEAAPQSISGAVPVRRASALEKGKGVRIRPVGVAQAAVVMRGRPSARIKLLSLADTRTLDARPEFRWQALAGAKSYHFNLNDPTGRTVLEFDVEGDSYKLPASVRLEEGANYSWDLSARLGDGRRYSANGAFSVLSAGQRQEVEALRPSAAAPLAERVAFAAWLEEQELRDEAHKYWKAAASERPQDQRLKQLAGE